MNPPSGHCPKCGGSELLWYDPFFFAPIRTLRFKRRLQCTDCRYVWRPQNREHGQITPT